MATNSIKYLVLGALSGRSVCSTSIRFSLRVSKLPCSSSKAKKSFLLTTLAGIATSAVVLPKDKNMGASMEEAMQLGQQAVIPDIVTEFMVDMKCEGCAKTVKGRLEQLEGVKSVTIDLQNLVVRVLGTPTVKEMMTALEETGRKARLIGQGSPEDFIISAAVAEFKGPQIHGVVRFAQVSMETVRVEASFTGLTPGVHGWSINEYGDLTHGAASTGSIYNPHGHDATNLLGDLGVLTADNKGQVDYSGFKNMLKVSNIIGRALVIYESADKRKEGIAAAVVARSAGVGENYKRICTCDGTIIWESSNNDFTTVSS